MISNARDSRRSRLPSLRIQSGGALPTFPRFRICSSTRRRRRSRQGNNCRYDEAARNTAYGKTVKNADRHRNVGTSACINNKRFRQLDVVTDDAYEVTASNARVTYDLPLHIGFFVYQYAKLRMLEFYYEFVDRYVAGVNSHFIHNRFVTVMHSTSHSSKSIVLTECAVLIVGTSSGPYSNTVKWTPTRRTSSWSVTPSTTLSGHIVGNTTSATDPNGFRPSAATSTKTTTSKLVSPDSCGQPPRRVASLARHLTRGRRGCSRLRGAVMGLLGCAR